MPIRATRLVLALCFKPASLPRLNLCGVLVGPGRAVLASGARFGGEWLGAAPESAFSRHLQTPGASSGHAQTRSAEPQRRPSGGCLGLVQNVMEASLLRGVSFL